MKIQTTRFGEREIPETDVFEFPEGLLGFEGIRSYVLLPGPGGGPFSWLQAAEVPSLAFVVLDPAVLFPEYRVKLRLEDMAPIGLEDVSAGMVRVIVTVPRGAGEITANLQGPLVLNRRTRRARQFVLSEPGLTTRHPVLRGAP